MIKRTVEAPPKPPEGWRTAVSKRDERIGYILRNMPDGYALDYQEVHHVLRLSAEYDKAKQEDNYYA